MCLLLLPPGHCRGLQRFSSISDTTTRVLKGGVANRWETRLNAVNDFLSTFRANPTAAILLRKADIRLGYIKQVRPLILRLSAHV